LYKTGYRVDPLPLYTGSRAPVPPGQVNKTALQPNTEPIIVSFAAWAPSHNLPLSNTAEYPDLGGEYIAFYYVGQIREDAVSNVLELSRGKFTDDLSPQVWEQGSTGQLEELNYTTHLVNAEEALLNLKDMPKIAVEVHVVQYAWHLWQLTLRMDAAK
jgi:hypothetical protein